MACTVVSVSGSLTVTETAMVETDVGGMFQTVVNLICRASLFPTDNGACV